MCILNRIIPCIFVTTFLAAQSVQAQDINDTWVKTYGGYSWGQDWAVSMAKTSDDGYILTGRFGQDTNNNEIWTLKIDSNGDTVWTRKYGKEWDDEGIFVKETSNGNYLVYGKFVNYYNEPSQIYDSRRILLKYDPIGNLVWSELESGPGEYCFISLESGIVLADIGAGALILTNKSDSDSLLWQKRIDFPLNFRHLKMVSTNDDGYILAGSKVIGSQPQIDVIVLIRTNSVGDTLWTKTYCEGNGKCVQQTFDGGYIIGGAIRQEVNTDGIALKVDAVGDTVWSRTIPMSWGSLNDVKQTSDSGYIFIGDSNGDIDLIKTNINGVIEWSRSIGGNSSEEGYCVEIANDGGYVILGRTSSFGSGGWDIFLAKTDKSGHVDMPTLINRHTKNITDFKSFNIYPNPMNNSAFIKFWLDIQNHVNITLFSIIGQKIKTLYDGIRNKGDHKISINSEGLSSGTYIIEIKTNDRISQKKIIIMK